MCRTFISTSDRVYRIQDGRRRGNRTARRSPCKRDALPLSYPPVIVFVELAGFVEFIGFVGFIEFVVFVELFGFGGSGVEIFDEARAHLGDGFGLVVDLFEGFLRYILLVKCYVGLALNFCS